MLAAGGRLFQYGLGLQILSFCCDVRKKDGTSLKTPGKYNNEERNKMANINFSHVADVYEKTALVQKYASNVLRDLLDIKNGEDVLDLGCGPGNITREVALATRGRVVGVDVAPGMIEGARRGEAGSVKLSFAVRDAYELGFDSEFDIIICNSAFQWFSSPDEVLRQCQLALKKGGRMGIQAPATSNYCPNFVAAEKKIRCDPVTGPVFAGYASPWFFQESAADYAQLFERNGFKVRHSEIVREETNYSAEQVFKIYQSGAENGYLNQLNYQEPLTQEYIETFRSLVRQTIEEQADENGMVTLVFYRIYLLAEKK